jgi:NCS1 family nucleobase:cation symporter-1
VNDNKNPTPEADSLQPTSATARVFSLGSYVLMWWSSLIVVQAFALGQGFLPPVGRLNLTQAVVVMVLAAGGLHRDVLAERRAGA